MSGVEAFRLKTPARRHVVYLPKPSHRALASFATRTQNRMTFASTAAFPPAFGKQTTAMKTPSTETRRKGT